MVVEEDVAFGPENMGVPTEEIWQRVAKSLESVDMTAYRYHSPNKLSGGQKQRIAIAGIMAMSLPVWYWMRQQLCWIRQAEERFWRLYIV